MEISPSSCQFSFEQPDRAATSTGVVVAVAAAVVVVETMLRETSTRACCFGHRGSIASTKGAKRRGSSEQRQPLRPHN